MKIIFKFISKINTLLSPKYIRFGKSSNPQFFLSYLVEPFFRTMDKCYMESHQNRYESVILRSVIEKLGFGGVIESYNGKSYCSDNFDIIMGLEPKFSVISKRNPSAIKIYYATGAFWQHQNKMIVERTDQVNRKYNTNLSYSRLVEPHDSIEVANYILQIGSSYTVDTYPVEYRCKIHLIDQSFVPIKNFDIRDKLKSSDSNHFLWFASGGTILKGLDLLLEYFSINTNLVLHVVGPIDEDFKMRILPLYAGFENIHIYGFLSLQSNQMKRIVEVCTYTILPSGSEGGVPGSVLTGMSVGLIPIVSRYASFDGIDKFGYIISDFTVDAIDKVIKDIHKETNEDILQKMLACSEMVHSRFNKSKFEIQLIDFFKQVLVN